MISNNTNMPSFPINSSNTSALEENIQETTDSAIVRIKDNVKNALETFKYNNKHSLQQSKNDVNPEYEYAYEYKEDQLRKDKILADREIEDLKKIDKLLDSDCIDNSKLSITNERDTNKCCYVCDGFISYEYTVCYDNTELFKLYCLYEPAEFPERFPLDPYPLDASCGVTFYNLFDEIYYAPNAPGYNETSEHDKKKCLI